MRSIDGRNNVKIYNLSAGKSLPDWLSDRKKRKLAKRDVDIRRRIELIQDFDMPDVSNCVKVSPDGQYILATGTYKPRVKCFEVSALSLKFERCFDSEVVQFQVLSEDYSKLVFLQEDRFIEFHNQGGRWFRTRIPRFGRDLAYHYPSCDLYIAASGNEIYRLNLNEGKFLNSIKTDSDGVNKCIFNPVHYLFTAGTSDGRIETWDPRSRHRVGVLDCALHMVQENAHISQYSSIKELAVTSLAYKDALTLGVGTQTGQILVYDLRSDKPLLVKDHMDGFPIENLFFPSSEKALSLSTNALKIWDRETGNPHTSIESDVKFNDLCLVPDSGMVFLATEDPKMQVYFLPSLGPAPKWCGHLDALIEELEEEDITPAYDDYKFVTEDELKQLGLDSLIGTNVLRAVMHGYYMDVRLYKKAKLTANVLDRDALLKKKVKQKILEDNQRKMAPSKLLQKTIPEVNKEYFLSLKEMAEKPSSDKAPLARTVLEDSRFASIFSNVDGEFDKESDAFNLIQPLTARAPGRFKQMGNNSDSEDEQAQDFEKAYKGSDESDSDSILSSDSEESSHSQQEEKITKVAKTKKKKKKALKTKPDATSAAKPLNKMAEFTSVQSFDELNDNWKQQKASSLAQRLLEEGDEDEEEESTSGAFGRKELKFTIKDNKAAKFDTLRQRQEQHRQERRKLVRNTKTIKGKIRMNKPFI